MSDIYKCLVICSPLGEMWTIVTSSL